MTFAYPYLLLLLLAVPVLAWLKGKRGNPPAFVYSSVQLVRPIQNITRTRAGAFIAALRWLALALFILALSQPRFSRSHQTISASGIDIVAAIDLSGSMNAEDFQLKNQRVNRLIMAQDVLKRFIQKRPSDRIGLVAFATEAYIAAPLTLDHEFLLRSLERLEIGSINETQTAIGSGLSTAINRLRGLKSKSKIVILMTDGQNNAGQVAPLTVAEAARSLKVKVYTIGVGTRGIAMVPVFYRGQKVDYRPQRVDIDEDTLKKIADMTGGKYYRADNSERFQNIYSEIDQLERSQAEVNKFTRHRELFAWLIAPGLGLVLLETLLRHTIFRRLP